MKINVAVLLAGAMAVQILLLGSGCREPDALAPRGYQVPQAEPDPDAYTEPVRPRTPPPATAVATPRTETEDFPAAPVYNPEPVRETPRRTPRTVDSTPRQYIVKKNDTLGKIGQQFGISGAALAKYNNLDINKYIQVGQVIMIPPPGTVINVERRKPARKTTAPRVGATAAPTTTAPAVAAAAGTGGYVLTDGYYLVRKHDSVSKIASRFKVKRADLMQANSINENTILQIGQKLVIPGKSPSSAAAVSTARTTRTVTTTPVTQPVATKPPVTVEPEKTEPVLPSGKSTEEILNDIEDPVIDTPPAGNSAAAVETAPTPIVATSLSDRRSIDIPTDTTWEQLAIMYGTTAEELKKRNPDVRDDKVVKAGKILFIP